MEFIDEIVDESLEVGSTNHYVLDASMISADAYLFVETSAQRDPQLEVFINRDQRGSTMV